MMARLGGGGCRNHDKQLHQQHVLCIYDLESDLERVQSGD